MEFLKQNILELGKYFQTNCIEIDKSTYFTVIIGQITIYGILVTPESVKLISSQTP